MLTSVTALTLLILAGAGLSGSVRRSTEECIPVCLCGIVLWLYVFYCIGAVRLGLLLLCLLIAGITVLSVRRAKGIRTWIANFVTPGVAVYLCICTLYVVFFSDNFVTLYDELRLWGAVPKAIHATGKLQLGQQSPIFPIMQSYPPALPLIGYFFSSFSAEFREGALFVGYTCAATAFFLPALAEWGKGNRALLAPAGLLLVLVPCFFTSHNGDAGLFGMSLFVDPLLGIVAGYVFRLSGQKPFRDPFRTAAFAVALTVLCLLKNTGIVFALPALLYALLSDLRADKKPMAVACLAVAFGAGSWKLLLLGYGVTEHIPMTLHRLSGTAITNILRALTSVNVVAYRVKLGFLPSFLFLFAVLWCLYALSFRLQRSQSGREAAGLAAAMLLSTGAFLYGYGLIFGETMESYPRYMSAPLLSLATCILLTVLPFFGGEKFGRKLRIGKGKAGILCCACLALCIGLLTVWKSIFADLPFREEADRDALRIQSAVESDLEEDTGWVYLVMAGDGLSNSHYHHRVFFSMISERVNIRNGVTQTQVPLPGETDAAERWARELENCDYVYLMSVEDGLEPVFAEFSPEKPEAGGLYRVEKADNALRTALHLVSQVPSE